MKRISSAAFQVALLVPVAAARAFAVVLEIGPVVTSANSRLLNTADRLWRYL